MPPLKGSRQARGDARRQVILDRALELFAADGYRGTSIAAVARAAGLTDAGLLHHFAGKDDLLRAVVEYRERLGDAAAVHLLEADGALAALREMPSLAQALVDRPVLARFDAVIGAESLGPGGPGRDRLAERMRGVRARLRLLLAEGIRSGEVRADVDPDAVATEIVAFMDGVQTFWLLDPDGTDLVAAYAAYFGRIVPALAAPRRRR